jgi:hypothetical protein
MILPGEFLISCFLLSIWMFSILGWGSGVGFGSDSVAEILVQIQQASIAILDRWSLQFQSQKNSRESKSIVFNNYFGLGEFHSTFEF